MNNYWLVKSNISSDENVLVFHPDVRSINSIIKEIKLDLSDNSKGCCDLIAFVGDRSERYLEFKVKSGSIDFDSIKKGNMNNEAIIITQKIYSKLPLGIINKIYPIDYRNRIIRLKETI